MLTKDFAICIRVLDFSETSQIATFFTKTNGKISVIAKGSKRQKSSFDGPIEIFSHGQIVFTATAIDKLSTLTEFEQQAGFTNLVSNFYGLNCCLFSAELLNQLTTETDPHPELFDSFLNFLQNVNTGQNSLLLLILFQLSLLREVGIQPVLNSCTNCKAEYNKDWLEVYFSSSANGLICRNCENSFPDRIKLSKKTADCFSSLNSLADTDPQTLKQIEKILIHHFTNILHHRPKMAKYIISSV